MTVQPANDSAPGRSAPDGAVPDGNQFLSDVLGKLRSIHGNSIAEDDPILMLATILQAFIGQAERVNKAQEAAMAAVLADRTKSYVDAVRTATDALGESLKHSTVEAVRDVFDRHTSALAEHKADLRWATLVMAGLVAGSLAAVVLMTLLR